MNKDKRKNIEEANKRLLGENRISETHANTDEEKIEYIMSGIKNLSSDSIQKVYKLVGDLDPDYHDKH